MHAGDGEGAADARQAYAQHAGASQTLPFIDIIMLLDGELAPALGRLDEVLAHADRLLAWLQRAGAAYYVPEVDGCDSGF